MKKWEGLMIEWEGLMIEWEGLMDHAVFYFKVHVPRRCGQLDLRGVACG